jgi:hypothetical protein
MTIQGIGNSNRGKGWVIADCNYGKYLGAIGKYIISRLSHEQNNKPDR